jgi:hypothetical protein
MNSNNSDYATLEEAFGVASFVAPEPPILRGDVGRVQETRHKKLKQQIETLGTHVKIETERERRTPAECGRCTSGTNCHNKIVHVAPSDSIAAAYAEGGPAAAWNLVPPQCRNGIVWHALKEYLDSDFVLMVLIGVALYVVLKK